MKKHNYEISIPHQPNPEGWGHRSNWKSPNLGPLEDEQKKKQRLQKLNAQRNKNPKKKK